MRILKAAVLGAVLWGSSASAQDFSGAAFSRDLSSIPMAPNSVLPPKPPEAGPVAGRDGPVTVSYRPTRKPELQRFEKLLRSRPLIEAAANRLAASIKFPAMLSVVFRDCNEDNAFYTSEDKTITMCYELFEGSAKLFQGTKHPEVNALYSGLWTFYHEAGHAMIDILDLPAVGREEDAVDQLSTLILVGTSKKEAEIARIAAEEFRLSAKQREKGEKPDLSDAHSLDQQRFYNILCLLYGKDPGANRSMVEKGELPKDRADECQDEYKQFDRAWNRLLAPYLRTQN